MDEAHSPVPGLCRDCLTNAAPQARRCAACGSPRLLRHRTLPHLHLAHIDCDAFYATVTKRDRPEIADKPVIIGGGKRGVVAAACYIARTYGVRSAMPMYKALDLCPGAVVIRPDMARYVQVGRQVRQAMHTLPPLVDPSDAQALMAENPVGFIYGVGPAMQDRLRDHGFRLIGELQRADEIELMRTFGAEGRRLWRLSHGIDERKVVPDRGAKVISSAPTDENDLRDYAMLERILWDLSETVSRRLKTGGLAGSTVTLKLKSADFRQRTRSQSIVAPTPLANRIFAIAREMLARETDGTAFR